MKVSKKQVIIASLVLLVFAGTIFAYFLITRENFVSPDSTAEGNNGEEISQTEENKITEEGVENNKIGGTETTQPFDYESDAIGVKNEFNKVKVSWDSLNSNKEVRVIYIKRRIGSIWSEWEKYELDFDLATRNSTYTTGEISISGNELKYAFNFNSGEYVKGLLFELDSSEKILIDEVRE